MLATRCSPLATASVLLALASGHGAVFVDVEVVAAGAFKGPAQHAEEENAAAGLRAIGN